MCNFFSAIVTRDGSVLFTEEDSHEEVISRSGLQDDLEHFVRVEHNRKNNYKIDEQTIPEWYERIVAKAEVNVKPIFAQMEPFHIEYQKIVQPAYAAYQKILTSAWADYEKIQQSAWAEKIVQPAYAAYEKIEQPAWVGYEKIVQPARAGYKKIKQSIFKMYIS